MQSIGSCFRNCRSVSVWMPATHGLRNGPKPGVAAGSVAGVSCRGVSGSTGNELPLILPPCHPGWYTWGCTHFWKTMMLRRCLLPAAAQPPKVSVLVVDGRFEHVQPVIDTYDWSRKKCQECDFRIAEVVRHVAASKDLAVLFKLQERFVGWDDGFLHVASISGFILLLSSTGSFSASIGRMCPIAGEPSASPCR